MDTTIDTFMQCQAQFRIMRKQANETNHVPQSHPRRKLFKQLYDSAAVETHMTIMICFHINLQENGKIPIRTDSARCYSLTRSNERGNDPPVLLHTLVFLYVYLLLSNIYWIIRATIDLIFICKEDGKT